MTQRDKLKKLFDSSTILRSQQITRRGIDPKTIQRMVEQQEIVRVGRGLYALPGRETSSNYSLVEAQHVVPSGVVCLFSALAFHGIGTQIPRRVHVAIRRRSHIPTVGDHPIHVHTFSESTFSEGVEEHELDGTMVRIYSPAKTVADCFKFRGTIGIDVAIEALRDTAQARKASVQDILHFAEVCRVKSVMQPYMEAIYT